MLHSAADGGVVGVGDMLRLYALQVLPQPVILDKRDWSQAIHDGDYLLALHIHGGMDYTPERVKRSCEMALAFYERYFPEYRYIGFWSESWLYDPGLAKILPPDRNIIRVQRQFYRYPTMEGDDMTRLEVLGGADVDYRTLKPRVRRGKQNRLQLRPYPGVPGSGEIQPRNVPGQPVRR